MEKKNRRLFILSVMVCLLPMVLGIVCYDKLPEQMPIHFTINDIPDNYVPKNFALFGLPAIMAVVQAICILFTTKANKLKNKEEPRIIKIMEWFIPIMTVVFYSIMIRVALGNNVYVGKSVCLILGILLMVIGNYTPKMSYEVGEKMFHPTPKSEQSFRKMTRITGYSFIGIGIVFLIIMLWV
ncbi:MAG: DUF1648 domain-containing protein [Clostridia bacterium]|nr:DUF1648 domain-containing protein [Clostridia bacterium]